MATSRKEHQPNARTNRSTRNMPPVLKPGEVDQGLRRARSVPTSPDRRSSTAPAATSSSNACRPSSSFNTRSASSRSTSGSSSSSSTHIKTLHSAVSSVAAAAKLQANAARRRTADKPGATSVWPPALATPNASSKDMTTTRVAKSLQSPSNVQKSKLSTRSGIEKMAAASLSLKLRTQKATQLGAVGAGKSPASSSSARAPGGAMAKKNPANSIQRAISVPAARHVEFPKIEEQEVDLLMEEFDEMESISTPSIEEHLQERLPDPVDVTTYMTSRGVPDDKECKNDHKVITQDSSGKKIERNDTGDLNGGDNADAGIHCKENIEKNVVGDNDLDETLTEDGASSEIVLKESVGDTELTGTIGEIGSMEAVDGTKLTEETVLQETVNETEVKDAELTVKEEAKATEEKIVLPMTKTPELGQRWTKDDGRSGETTEEGKSKLTMQERRNKVMALVGRFETAMSGRE